VPNSQLATLVYDIIQEIRARQPDRPALVGVAGAQGSGKTTVCKLLEAANRPHFAYFSLDDVYFSRAEREENARELVDVHAEIFPTDDTQHFGQVRDMLATRGPPGTHDLALANGLIARLKHGLATPIPRFDKVLDERTPERDWATFQGRPEAILIDGWCIGALPAPVEEALNVIEAQDKAALLSVRSDDALRTTYAQFFRGFDAIVYLRPPSWEIVFQWRLQQEEQLLGRALDDDERAKLERFILHYERITRSMMDGVHMADWVVQLDEARNVVSVANPPKSRP